jgi:hypothetical protein
MNILKTLGSLFQVYNLIKSTPNPNCTNDHSVIVQVASKAAADALANKIKAGDPTVAVAVTAVTGFAFDQLEKVLTK